LNILLDTCTFLWITKNAPELSSTARVCFQDPGNTVYLSSISVWEMVVKHALGRLPLPQAPDRFIPAMRSGHGIAPLALEEEAACQLSKLPDLHKDPFDRILVCQALVHGLVLLTPDEMIRQYPVRTIW
jgi:PIN domain nuclease of toxin-antitoxin system